MSKLGKAFLFIALIGILASGVFGYLVVEKKKETEGNLESTTGKLTTTSATLKKTQDDLKSSDEKLTATTGKLTEATTKGQALQTSLTEAETKVTQLTTDKKTAEEKTAAAEAKVEEVNKALGGDTPGALKAAALKAQEELTTMQREKKIIDDQLSTANAEVARLKDIMRRRTTGEMPPGIAGKVMSVNTAWNFVVLNVGEKDGVVENGTLIVYRGKNLIGKVKVVSAEANTSVADILPEWKKGDIKSGDDIFN